MADETLTSNLDLTATDRASAVIVSAAKRMRDATKEYERAIKDLRKSEADATADGLKEIELKKRAQDSWAKLQRAQSASLAEDTAKHQDRIRREAEKTGAAQKKAAAESAAAYTAAGGALLKYAAGFATVGTVISGVQKGFMAFAEHERQLTTMRTNMRLTKEEEESWAKSSQALSAKTGLSTDELTQSLVRYRSQSKQTFTEAVVSHEQLAQAAANSGTSIRDWEKIGATATRSVSGNVKGVIDGWRATIPQQMVAPFADGLGDLTDKFNKAGIKIGPEFAHQLGAAMKNTEGVFKAPEDGAKALMAMLEESITTSTNFGKIMEGETRKLKAGQIDLIEYLQKAQEEARAQGLFMEGQEGERAQERMKLTVAAVDALRAPLHGVREEADRSKASIGGVVKETEELAKGPLGAVNRLSAAYEALKVAAGGALDASGGSKLMQGAATGLNMWSGAQSKTSVPLVTPGNIMFELTKRMAVEGYKQFTAPGATPGATPGASPFRRRGASGGFATGGEFVVPGSGGTDTTPVDFMATPGEKVSIEPQGGRKDSLQVQQDKADQSMREHFARFHASDRARKAAWDLGGMYDSKGNYTGKGGGGGGGGSGGDPAGGTRTGTGTGGGGQASGTGPAGTGDGGTGIKTPVGLDETSQTGPAENLEDAYKRGYLKPPGGDAGPDGSPYLAQQRAKLFADLDKDPQTKEMVMRAISTENRTGQPGSQAAIMERMVNASIRDNKSIKQTLYGGFYGPVNKGKTNAVSNRAFTQSEMDQVRGGSNLIDLRTDQGMWQPGHYEHPYAKQVGADAARLKNIRGEFFSDQDAKSVQWSNAQRQRMTEYDASHGGVGARSTAAPGTSTTAELKTQLEGSGGSAALDDALKIEGLHEVRDREAIKAYLGGWDPVGRSQAWCARFVNSALAHTGGTGTGSEAAASFKTWGEGVKGAPQAGDVMLAGDHHVGFATGKTRVVNGQLQYEMYSGNASDLAKRDWRAASGLDVRRGTEKELGKAASTQVAGPAQISDVETRAGVKYRAAQERAAAPTAPAGPTFTQRARAARAAAPKAMPAPVRRMPSAPGQEDRAAGKGRPAPIVQPVSAPASTGAFATRARAGRAAAKATAPAATGGGGGGEGPGDTSNAPSEGLAAGGPVNAGQTYLVGEEGPEWFSSARSGSVIPMGQPRGGGGGIRGPQLDPAFEEFKTAMSQPIEPIIRPRIQNMGPASMRWTRHAERNRDMDNTRRAARDTHVDLGFQS